MAAGNEPCGLLIRSLVECVRVVTHPRLFDPSVPLHDALDKVAELLATSSFVLLLPGERFWTLFDRLARAGGACGNLALDAQIAALCLEHRVAELWTADRDFLRFPDLRTRNPLSDS